MSARKKKKRRARSTKKEREYSDRDIPEGIRGQQEGVA